jgi:hypothetical protein
MARPADGQRIRRRLALAALLLAVVLMALASRGTRADAAADRWGAETVVRADALSILRRMFPCRLSADETRCEIAVLRRTGASVSAISFFRIHGGFLSEFRELGRVDVGVMNVPIVNTGGDSGPVLLNGVPDFLTSLGAVRRGDFTRDAGFVLLRRALGGLTLTTDNGGIHFEGTRPEDGAEAVVLQAFLIEPPSCHGCTSSYAERVELAFDSDGRLTAATALGLCEQPFVSPLGRPIAAPPCASFPARSFTQSLLTPGQLSVKFTHVATNVLLALALVLLIPFPTELFNSTLEANYDRVTAPLRELGRFLPRFPTRERRWRGRGFVLFAGTMVVTSLLYCLLDPTFGWNRSSLALFVGILGGLVVVTVAFDLVALWFMWRRHRARPAFRAYGAALPIAAACVVVSRAAHFQPGYLLGAIAGLSFAVALSRQDEGRLAARSAAWILGLSLIAWVARTPVVDAEATSSRLGLQVLDATMAAIVVGGIEGVAFGLLPLRFLAGEQVMAWSRRAWLALFGLAVLAFVFVVLNPQGNFVGSLSVGSVWSTIALVAGFTVVSVAMWAWFRMRPERPGAPPSWGPGPGRPEGVAEPTHG